MGEMTGSEALDGMMSDRCGDGVMQARMFLARAEVARLRRMEWEVRNIREQARYPGRTLSLVALFAALDGGEGK